MTPFESRGWTEDTLFKHIHVGNSGYSTRTLKRDDVFQLDFDDSTESPMFRCVSRPHILRQSINLNFLIEIEPPEVTKPMEDNKYNRIIKGTDADAGKSITVDVYSILDAFKTGCPALDHAIKKLLAHGSRGVKSSKQDKEEAIEAIRRSIELGE